MTFVNAKQFQSASDYYNWLYSDSSSIKADQYASNKIKKDAFSSALKTVEPIQHPETIRSEPKEQPYTLSIMLKTGAGCYPTTVTIMAKSPQEAMAIYDARNNYFD